MKSTAKPGRLKRTCLILAIMLLFAGLTACAAEEATDDTAGSVDYTVTTDATPPYAKIEVEGHGTIVVELDASAAPITVENFITLAKDGFYDGLTFHRIIDGFMIQGGDPLGNGTGGSDQSITGEFSANGVDNPITHDRGVISMARSGQPNSASSQFFIVHQPSPHLDGQYAAFGHVTDGMDIVDELCKQAKPTDNNGTIPAANQPVIRSIVIVE